MGVLVSGEDGYSIMVSFIEEYSRVLDIFPIWTRKATGKVAGGTIYYKEEAEMQYQSMLLSRERQVPEGVVLFEKEKKITLTGYFQE